MGVFPRMFRRRLALAASVAAAVLSSACQAEVSTVVSPGSDGVAEVSATVTLTGAAARSLVEDPASEQRLLATMAAAIPGGDIRELSPERDGDRWTLTVPVDPARVASSSSFTALSSVVTSPATDGGTTVALAFAPPSAVASAFDAATASRPDAADARAALGAATFFEVVVRFPGGVTSAPTQVGSVPVTVEEDQVRVRFTLDEAPTGVLVLTGVTTPTGRPWWLLPSAAVFVAAAGVFLFRPRRAVPQHR